MLQLQSSLNKVLNIRFPVGCVPELMLQLISHLVFGYLQAPNSK